MMTSLPQTRKKTLVELQPFLVTYSALTAAVAPLATLYQLLRINPHLNISVPRMISLSAAIFPSQAILKTAQMNVMSPIKEHVNVWAGFAVMGILQGGIYGNCNIFFARQLGISKTADYKGLFRGALFAPPRDMISQGVPFVCSAIVRDNFILPLVHIDENTSPLKRSVVYWSSILSTSVVATFMSQSFQNLQIHMQSHPDFNYVTTISDLYNRNGLKFLWKGAEARVGLLLYVNVLNDLVLKKAWEPVDC